ncbi:hypothetical protein [Mycolicibacterium sp.]|uniref:hypothetical protein n=1 Tax=Mycolicibacterium sp. TaxID=2320850 RepID=UPI0037CBA55F
MAYPALGLFVVLMLVIGVWRRRIQLSRTGDSGNRRGWRPEPRTTTIKLSRREPSAVQDSAVRQRQPATANSETVLALVRIEQTTRPRQ